MIIQLALSGAQGDTYSQPYRPGASLYAWHLGKRHHCVQVLRTRGYDVAAVALMDSSGGNAAALQQHLGCCHLSSLVTALASCAATSWRAHGVDTADIAPWQPLQAWHIRVAAPSVPAAAACSESSRQQQRPSQRS